MNDWDRTYARAAIDFLAGRDPYLSGLFGSPPWSLFGLVPTAWIHPHVAMLLPVLALLFLSYRARKPHLLIILGTSFPFIACVVYANIDWVVMIGVAIGGRLGVILSTIKPQDGAFAILAEVSKRPTWQARARLLLPLAICVLLTAPLMLSWLHWLPIVGASNNGIRNFSLFPYSAPLGFYLLWRTWRCRDPLAGCAASLCLSPYFYIHSIIPAMYLLSARNWRWGIAVNAITWGVVWLIVMGVIPIKL